MKSLSGLISIARKAGYVIVGADNLSVYDKKLYLLLMDKTAGKSLRREANFLAENRDIPLIELDNLQDLVKIENCKIVGIKNKNLSDEISKLVESEK